MRLRPDQLATDSLLSEPWGLQATHILRAALLAVDPAESVHRHLKRQGNQLDLDGNYFDLTRYRKVILVGAGKAGTPMARAVIECLEGHLIGGLVIVKEGYAESGEDLAAKGVTIFEAGHPFPDERGRLGTRRILEVLHEVSSEDLVVCVISGGGSALMHALAPGVSLEDMQRLTGLMLSAGADIQEINSLRKHLDQIKGGGLARAAAPAEVITLILSDVVGDPLDVIASGPTVPDRSSFQDAWTVLERYDLLDRVPASIHEHLERGVRGEIPETPKDGENIFRKVTHCLVGSNQQAAEAALRAGCELGFEGMLLTTRLQGEARARGRALGALLRQLVNARQADLLTRPICLVAGGETTVTITGSGKGGRNQEVALGAVAELAGLDGVGLVTLATDGGDGPTDAAGAVVTGNTLKRALSIGMDPQDYLLRNDSYHFFDDLGDLIKTGPTQTNVNDLTFLFCT